MSTVKIVNRETGTKKDCGTDEVMKIIESDTTKVLDGMAARIRETSMEEAYTSLLDQSSRKDVAFLARQYTQFVVNLALVRMKAAGEEVKWNPGD